MGFSESRGAMRDPSSDCIRRSCSASNLIISRRKRSSTGISISFVDCGIPAVYHRLSPKLFGIRLRLVVDNTVTRSRRKALIDRETCRCKLSNGTLRDLPASRVWRSRLPYRLPTPRFAYLTCLRIERDSGIHRKMSQNEAV